jgi:hypothetical protein
MFRSGYSFHSWNRLRRRFVELSGSKPGLGAEYFERQKIKSEGVMRSFDAMDQSMRALFAVTGEIVAAAALHRRGARTFDEAERLMANPTETIDRTNESGGWSWGSPQRTETLQRRRRSR